MWHGQGEEVGCKDKKCVVQRRNKERMTAVRRAREFLPKQMNVGPQYIEDPHPCNQACHTP